jgi:hypothetical protein|tara:strand:+ start:1656 stop:2327 length:672 start_codon:yes stop_codon:yes gene_type:complete
MSTQQEWSFIHGLVRLQRPRIAVEVGVAYGGMATSIYKAMHENFVDTGVESWYTGFDLWDTHGVHGQFGQMGSLELVDQKLKDIGPRYALVKLDTQKQQQEFKTQLAERFTLGIDFAFIDGCHSYDGLKNDFYNILPHMNPKGIIALHDTSVIDGCREFVIDLRLSDNLNFDIMDFPYGTNERNCGVTILTTPGHGDVKIDEICGSPSVPEDIYEKENNYRRV